MPLSHAPVWQDGRSSSRALMMRVFLVADGRGDYRVLPGGLLAHRRHGRASVVSGQRGGGSKDTWVLSDAPVERFSLLPGRLRPADIARSERMVSSRAAEHLFWMGRYAERSENARPAAARGAVAAAARRSGDRRPARRPIVAACRRHGLLPADGETRPALSSRDVRARC